MHRDNTQASRRQAESLGRLHTLRIPAGVILLAISVLTAVLYYRFGLVGGISRDGAIYLYSGQMMAEGVPPYVSVFDHKGPLTPMLAGAGVFLSNFLGADDIMTVRTLFFMLGCLAVASSYLLGGHLFRSYRAGLYTALTFLALFCFGRYATAEPEAKTPMLLFEVLALLYTSQRRWFRAGLFGSLAFLVWQPMAVFGLVTLALAIFRPGGPRSTAVWRVLAGGGLPVALTATYFYLEGAFYELVNGSILFNVRYLQSEQFSSLVPLFAAPAKALFQGYSTPLIPIVSVALLLSVIVAAGMLARLYLPQARPSGGIFGEAVRSGYFAPILLSLPFPILWSVIDFQGYPDFFVFIPYVALGFGGFLSLAVNRVETSGAVRFPSGLRRTIAVTTCAALTAMAVVSSLITIDLGAKASSLATDDRGPAAGDLDYQKRAAYAIEERFGANARVVSIGVPQLLVLLGAENPNPYAFIIRGIDRQIAAETPGGFEGWLRDLKRYDPAVIAIGETSGSYKAELLDWLGTYYDRDEVGPWTLYVKKGYPTTSSIAGQQTAYEPVAQTRSPDRRYR
jgi:hypothetical protein